MKIIELSANQLAEGIGTLPETTLAIGDFDGVHLGHQKVLQTALNNATKSSTSPAVMIFHPHPRVLLGLGGYEQLITPLHHRLRLFAEFGMDTTYLVSFDREFSEWSADKFTDIGIRSLNVKNVVVGFDFTYGYRGIGNVDTLRAINQEWFDVDVVPPLQLSGQKISSTRIRTALKEGHVMQASKCLGRFYSVHGTVVAGDARGRTIGFPTANVLPNEPYLLPKHGVYVATLRLWNGTQFEGDGMPAVMNVGRRPTFEGLPDIRIEVHILDQKLDLYGKRVEVQWLDWIREEQKFDSKDQLISQIHEDVHHARNYFSTNSGK